jgi:hypothetical protein
MPRAVDSDGGGGIGDEGRTSIAANLAVGWSTVDSSSADGQSTAIINVCFCHEDVSFLTQTAQHNRASIRGLDGYVNDTVDRN